MLQNVYISLPYIMAARTDGIVKLKKYVTVNLCITKYDLNQDVAVLLKHFDKDIYIYALVIHGRTYDTSELT